VRNPFPGPQPYRASDRSRFYGREEMAYHLEGYILANACVTVYGPSGAGKSSLVQAAVLPALVDKEDIRVVRVDGWPEDQDPTRWLADALHGDLGLGARPDGTGPAEALLTAAQRAARRSSRLVLVYLDQMEQLLYASRSAKASVEFFDCLNRLVELPLRNLRVVLSLREDYLGRFRDRLRDQRRVLDHGFRVGPLTVGDLCQAVCHAAASGEPPQLWEPDAMRPLMLQVRVPGQAATDEAEGQSAYAQIVCRALFQERAEGRGAESESEAEPILRRYLEATLADLGELRPSAERLLEDHLVTADGSRTLRTEKELLRLLPAEKLLPVLKALEGAAILHAEEHQGSRYFEIGHDWLARKVFDQRSQREQEEARQRERAEAAARLAEEHERRRRLRSIAIGAGAIAVFATALTVWSTYNMIRAERAEEGEALALTAEKAAHTEADTRRIEAQDATMLGGYRELSLRDKIPWGMKLLLTVDLPSERRGWAELANDALQALPPLLTLDGHRGPLAGAVWSPDSRRVLTASDDWTARAWNADGKGKTVLFEGHKGPVAFAAWSDDGTHVVTVSDDKTARVWSADGAGTPVTLSGHTGFVVFASFSHDGKRVVTASTDQTALVWSADGAGTPVTLKGHQGPVSCAVFDPSGRRVLTASYDKTARIWNADGTGAPVTLSEHTGRVVFLALSPDGTRVVTASDDKTARIWSADGKGPAVVLKGHTAGLSHAAWSPDGLRVATASEDGTARVWRADGKGTPVVLAGHAGPVTSVAFAPDGKYLATASSDGTVRFWPAVTPGAPAVTTAGPAAPPLPPLPPVPRAGPPLPPLPGGGPRPPPLPTAGAAVPAAPAVPSLVLRGHEGTVVSARFSPDGKYLLTAGSDSVARVWSTADLGAALGRQGAGPLHAAFISPDGATMAVASADQTGRVARLDGQGTPVVVPRQDARITGVALSPRGDRLVLASSDKTARVLSADGTGAPVVLRGHEAEVRAAVFGPDGSTVVTASEDRTARVFGADGKERAVLRGHGDWLSSAGVSPDGARIVTTSLDGTARLWKPEGGEALAVLKHEGPVYAASWSPDGKRVATASEDHFARIWSADGAGEPVKLKHESGVLRLAWSADGARVATASSDQSVRVWSADGRGDPLRLEAPSPVLALAFADGGKKLVAVGEDGVTRAWIIDVDLLTQRLADANADCLPAEQRDVYLGKTAGPARRKYEVCEPPVVAQGHDRSLADLGPDARRVKLTVLPADARVEVDGRTVARRDGFIELTGKVKETHRLHVWKGSALPWDWTVTIEASGASPPELDLDHAGRRGAPAGPELSRAVAAALKHVESFD
jgi:WD40 repeat protein